MYRIYLYKLLFWHFEALQGNLTTTFEINHSIGIKIGVSVNGCLSKMQHKFFFFGNSSWYKTTELMFVQVGSLPSVYLYVRHLSSYKSDKLSEQLI